MDCKFFAAYGPEFEDTGQCNDVLRNRIVVPVKGRMWWRFLKMDRFHFDQYIFTHASTLHVGVPILTCIQIVCSDHCCMLLICNTAAVSARIWRLSAVLSMRDSP